MPGLGEADTRAMLIDPCLRQRGWTDDLVRREETAGTIDIVDGQARRRAHGRADYVLRVRVTPSSQPVAVALIEAKREDLAPDHGLTQAKGYASCRRLNVPFVFATNGHLFVQFDRSTGTTAGPQPLSGFPTPADLRQRYEQGQGFSLDAPAAAPLLIPYLGGEATRRYYQDAATRAALEKVVRCTLSGTPARVLLSLATGAGKTFIAVSLLKRIDAAGGLRKALFVCDRDELRTQALAKFHEAFGNDAAEVRQDAEGWNLARNARVHIATYQTLGLDDDILPGQFIARHYPRGYFSHIVIDECHRSAWGRWSSVLTRYPEAVHIGLTATPRRLKVPKRPPATAYAGSQAAQDVQVVADNRRYFGPAVYEYDLAQGIEDGYLAALEIRRFDLFHDSKDVNERLAGVDRTDLAGKSLTDANTGAAVSADELRDHYSAALIEDRLLMPERVAAMCQSLFAELIATGGPEQKTIVFCARDRHADAVVAELGNLYAEWCAATGCERRESYAFKCTAAASGNDQLPDLRASRYSHFVAATVDLLTTGVDVPCVRNIVFFRYVQSPIGFYQMVGRGTRVDVPTGKLMFRVYDYTDATRLFGREFLSRAAKPRERVVPPPPPPPPPVCVEGVEVRVTPAGHLLVTEVDGRAMPVTVEEYKARLAARLVQEVHDLGQFRAVWVTPDRRRELLDGLGRAGLSPAVVSLVDQRQDYDLYDVLAELGWGLAPRTRRDRATAFVSSQGAWLDSLPPPAAAAVRAVVEQFARGGTESLESTGLFDTETMFAAGGLDALRIAGRPSDLLREAKLRVFAA